MVAHALTWAGWLEFAARISSFAGNQRATDVELIAYYLWKNVDFESFRVGYPFVADPGEYVNAG